MTIQHNRPERFFFIDTHNYFTLNIKSFEVSSLVIITKRSTEVFVSVSLHIQEHHDEWEEPNNS